MIYFKNTVGDVFAYETQEDRDIFGADDLVAMTPGEVSAHLYPVMTDEQMKQSEIAQDKQYLADTDWVISKISEASLTGQDTETLLVQYDAQIKEREMARIRIRTAEGKL